MSRRAIVVFVLVAASGCSGSDQAVAPDVEVVVGSSWRGVSEEELAPAQHAQLDRALAARDQLAATLMGELKSELEVGGPSGAVAVCRDMAPMIAEHVADDHGLAIGRTSHRLRNPDNLAPAWAESAVDDLADATRYFSGPAGELGVLLPIKLGAPCLACHGPAESMDEGVRAALAQSYPDDRATDFAEGDLRGWFWVEVPGEG
jgi:hypothetical protein